MSSVSEEVDSPFSEKKIRFRPTKVLFNDNKVEDLYRNNDKADVRNGTPELGNKKGWLSKYSEPGV